MMSPLDASSLSGVTSVARKPTTACAIRLPIRESTFRAPATTLFKLAPDRRGLDDGHYGELDAPDETGAVWQPLLRP